MNFLNGLIIDLFKNIFYNPKKYRIKVELLNNDEIKKNQEIEDIKNLKDKIFYYTASFEDLEKAEKIILKYIKDFDLMKLLYDNNFTSLSEYYYCIKNYNDKERTRNIMTKIAGCLLAVIWQKSGQKI